MRNRAILFATGAAVALGASLTVGIQRTKAQAAYGQDECAKLAGSTTPTLCEHVFKDRTKCVVYYSPEQTSGQLACKLTEVSHVPDVPDVRVS